MQVKDILEHRLNNEIPKCARAHSDPIIQKCVNERCPQIYFAAPASWIKDIGEILKEKKLFVKGIFDVLSPPERSVIILQLWVVKRIKPKSVLIGSYKRNSKNQEYDQYIKQIDLWLNNPKKIPQENNFNEVSSDIFNFERENLDYFSKKATNIRQKLSLSKSLKLIDCASVLRSRMELHKKDTDSIYGKVLTFCEGLVSSQEISTKIDIINSQIRLHKNDICAFGKKFCLLTDEPQSPLYATNHTTIIRANEKLLGSKYLFYYLKSELAQHMLELDSSGFVLPRLTLLAWQNFPIYIPDRYIDNYATLRKDYQSIFQIDLDNKHKQSEDGITKCLNELHKISDANDEKDLLAEEQYQKLLCSKNEELNKLLKEDLEELNKVYQAKAYKAVIILTGAILEAFLTDWCGVLDGKDYFKEPFEGSSETSRGMLRLNEAIEHIGKVRIPKWLEIDQAKKIQRCRNNIHAQLCIKGDIKIDHKLSEEMLNYLKEVIESRQENL